ncbi:MAG: D-alanyl-D-alanine dipeptidase [candidate division TM6 bacterium GW2011_GWE2_41_16]|nr:MAG: D-alanyl-D-alanine dipeptidase [candidate division TM6 bacterium GW2011_GWE2_41_16]
MKLSIAPSILCLLCFFCQTYADWQVTCNDETRIILAVCKENLDKEQTVFNKTFTKAYQGTEIEQMILKQYPSLASFLTAAFENVQNDFNSHKPDTFFISAKKQNGDVVGFAAFYKKPERVYLWQLAVDPEYQHLGIGQFLMYAFLNNWKDCYNITLATRRLNTHAIDFYKKHGFNTSNFVGDHLDPAVYIGMEQNINPEFIASITQKYEKLSDDNGIPAHKILSLPIVSPCITHIKIEECGEPLVDLYETNNKRIVPLTAFDSKYNPGHNDAGKVRQGLYEHLLLLLSYLPENVGLAVFEGYRPLWKQKEYFVKKFTELAQTHPDKSFKGLEGVYSETCKFVSPFIDNIPVHCTGAAIDFMLFTRNANDTMELLDLGKFGVIFGPNDQAKTLSENISVEQTQNRKMLLDAAAQAGLVNYGYEWWHYSYGDRAWAYVENKGKALYGLVHTEETNEELTKEDFLNSMQNKI